MLAYRHVKPSRCAYGQGTIGATSGKYNFVALYNDSPAPYVLAVHDVAPAGIATTVVAAFVVENGSQGTPQTQGKPVVSNRQQMAGTIYTGAVAALPTIGFSLGNLSGVSNWFHDFPMIVIAPGWALTRYALTLSAAWGGTFWWQVLTPEELDEMYGDEIDIRVS